MWLCVTISLGPDKVAFKVMSDRIRTQCHITTPKPPNYWEAQLLSIRWDPTLLLRLLWVYTLGWPVCGHSILSTVYLIWDSVNASPLVSLQFTKCISCFWNDANWSLIQSYGNWGKQYNSVVICTLKRKHSISVLKCTLMYIQKRCNIHKSFTNKNV